MAAPASAHSLDLLLLTWAAATLDALAYLRASVFTANMTGNAVVLGIDFVAREHRRELPAALAMLAFCTGAFLAGLVLIRYCRCRHWEADMRAGLALELPFVVAFAVLVAVAPPLPPRWATIALIVTGACGLGIQSAAVRRLRVSGVATTFMTGTITSAVMAMVSPPEATPEDASYKLLLAMFVCYIVAAGTAAILYRRNVAVASLSGPAAVAAVWIRSLKRK